MKLPAILTTVLAIVSGCGDPTIDMHSESLATEGRWRIPTHILAQGDEQQVEYTGAGPWYADERSCQGDFTAGGQALGDYIKAYFAQVDVVYGYACRPIVGNPNETSVRATGRALDIMIRTTAADDADNDLGDPIAHWLIQNAESIGIQFIIWDKTTWGAERQVGAKEHSYGGSNPHVDHLHVELSVEAGDMQTPWFESEQGAPVIDSCPALPAEGGVIDDSDACTQLLGPGQFWRSETGQGYGDSLVWTNAIEKNERSNWARWQIVPSVAGEYELEIFGDSEFSAHKKARYELVHGEESKEFVVDQSELSGWHSLGTFAFAAGGGQGLEVFDNNTEPVGADQHIAVDAIRLTAVDADPDPDPDPIDDEPGGLFGGCSSGGGSGGLGGLLLLLAWFASGFTASGPARHRQASSHHPHRVPRQYG